MPIAVGRLLLVLGLIAIWEVLPLTGLVDPFFVSRPDLIVARIADWAVAGTLFADIAVTVGEAAAGFLLGAVTGTAFGLLCGLSEPVGRTFLPLVTVANSLPKLAFAPLLIAWFGFGISSKIALSAAVVFFFTFFGVFSGLRSSSGVIVANARIMGGRGWAMLWHVHLPSAFAWIMAGIRLGVAYAFAAAVVGEYLGSDSGLGYLIMYGKEMLDMTDVFAGLTIVMVIVGGADVALRRLTHAGVAWSGSGRIEEARV